MNTINTIQEANEVLAQYVPQVREMLGRDITLERMIPLMKALGNPESKLKIIHIAGTSGKTSTAYYVASLLEQSGKKVGLTVSPHLDSITERVQINLCPISDDEFCTELSEFIGIIKDIQPQPTYFELLIAFVYWYFAKTNVDYAVIETGLGGLHDASNVAVSADKICVITDIGFDHMHVLGNSLPEIASQKAGIIHPNNQVFMYDQGGEITDVFREYTQKQHAKLNVLSNAIVSKTLKELAQLNYLPMYQQRNWVLAHEAYRYLSTLDGLPELSPEKLESSVKIQVPGRMDIMQVNGKTLIMDGAHNAQKMQAFVSSFQQLYPNKKAAILLSLKQDKEFQAVLPLLKPICSKLMVTSFLLAQDLPSKPTNPKTIALEATRLAFENVSQQPNLKMAYHEFMNSAEDILIITGSFYLISNLRKFIGGMSD